ncbi:MAG TPA: DUF6766 family protein [Myxococcaceae bacterium]|nr:DUF6766 family protein [Myxococcaceae bacterium]
MAAPRLRHCQRSVVKRVLRDNGLTLVMTALFLVFLLGNSVAGWLHYNEEQRAHGTPEVPWTTYVHSGEFAEAVFENWESEFLQMAAFVFLAAKLRQRGSPESKEDGEEENPERDKGPDSPGPVHRGGLALKLYSHSLTLALLALFLFSMAMHAVGGHSAHNEEAAAHGRPLESLLGYVTSSTFWFESFQNWQSEFFSIAMLVVLSIFLREKDSPESKPVREPHSKTGR